MCPACLTSLALTVATTTGAGAVATAFVVRATRSLVKKPKPTPQDRKEPTHEHVGSNRHT
ncbi:MAG TPA: hypothetical protein VM580_15190 [Labilithrix sp.]|nr:hypothetical protein [Labilithrix sp.]